VGATLGGGAGFGGRGRAALAGQRGHTSLSSQPISRLCVRHQKRTGDPHASHSCVGSSCSTPQLGHRSTIRFMRLALDPVCILACT
jgi:hypothetical protein